MSCPNINDLIDSIVGRILSQYRESPKLIQTAKDMMQELGIVYDQICRMPEYFDIDTAIGDQLTIIGKWLGWPRVHCRGRLRPVFGVTCPDRPCESLIPITGICEPGDEDSSWIDCDDPRFVDFVFDEDELYRKFLKARRYQILGLYDYESLKTVLNILWGPTAWVADFRTGEVVVTPGRLLTEYEKSYMPVTFAVLPVAPGIDISVHLEVGKIFGIGTGWGGICDGPEIDTAPITQEGMNSVWLHPQKIR